MGFGRKQWSLLGMIHTIVSAIKNRTLFGPVGSLKLNELIDDDDVMFVTMAFNKLNK